MADKHRSLLTTLTFPIALGLFSGALLLGPVSAQAEPFPNLPIVNITSASGSVIAGAGGFGMSSGIEASFSAPGFSLGFRTYLPPDYFNASVGDTLSTFIDLHEVYGAPASPGGTVTFNGTEYQVDYAGTVGALGVRVEGPSLTVPPGYATIQIPAGLSGSGLACTAGSPYYPTGCFPPPNVTQPTLIANVNINIGGYLTYTFAPAVGPAFNDETYSAIFTPTPEPAAALLLLGALPILFLLRRLTTNGPLRSPTSSRQP